MSLWLQYFQQLPAVTRTILVPIVLGTLGVSTKVVSGKSILLLWPRVANNWEVWRLLSCFCYAGEGFELLFAVFMLYRNSASLEMGRYANRTADYALTIFSIVTLIIALNYPLRTYILFRPFMYAITYLWSRANEGSSVSFFGFISVPALYYPFALILFDLTMQGTAGAITGLSGVLAGHIWYYIDDVMPSSSATGDKIINPPNWLINLLEPTRAAQDAEIAAIASAAAAQARSRTRTTDFGATIIQPSEDGRIRQRTAAANAAGGRSNTSQSAPNTGESTGYRWGQGGQTLGGG